MGRLYAMENRLELILRYAADKGYFEQSYLLDCIRKGQSGNIKAVLHSEEYSNQMERILGNDISLAKRVFSFMWPKIVYVAGEGGFVEPFASERYNKYYHNLQRATSVRSILEMNKRVFVEFAEKVASSMADARFSPLVGRIHRHIDAHIYEKITVSHIAEKLRLSRFHLSHVYKRETGKTITNEIQRRKILEAKHLLQYSSLSSSDIGSKLGFCSQSHFTSIFQKETGMTPYRYAIAAGKSMADISS
jgi:AraC-like DNA-binding protein